MKKKFEGMGEGVEVESEVGGVERDHGQLEDSDDVIGPPLPPGYNVKREIMISIQHTMYMGVCTWFKILHTCTSLVQESEAGPSGSVEHNSEGEGPEEEEEEGDVSTT